MDGRESVEDVLMHYGVKGMKWGVRRARSSRPMSKEGAEGVRLSNRAKKNGVKSLSNKELEKLNKRVELERKYTKNNPGIVKKGATAIASVLAVASTASAVVSLPNNPAVKLGVTLIKRMTNPAVAAITRG